MSKSVHVIVPAYNEARVIELSLRPLIDRGYSVVVVDDGSSDGTWSILTTLPVAALRHRMNLGHRPRDTKD